MASAMIMTGDLAGADVFLRPHERRAQAASHRSASARLGAARGQLLGAMGDISSARESFDEVLELLDGLPLRVYSAWVNSSYGLTLRRACKRREAEAVIRMARDIFAGLGAQTYVSRSVNSKPVGCPSAAAHVSTPISPRKKKR